MATAQATRLLEREQELATIHAALERAREGRGETLVIEGPAGIGKSSLLDATVAEASGFQVLSSRGGELERDLPFGVARQLLEPRLRGASDAERARLLSGAAERCAPLVLGEAPAPASGGDAASELVGSLYWLLASLAEDAPLVLAVDDAHWADAGSLHLMAFLAARMEGLAMLTVMATRPPQAGWHPVLVDPGRTTTRLRLEPLSDASVATVVRTELAAGADERFVDACRDATGGNPYYLHELVRELAADRVAPTADQAGRVSELGPETVARAVFARIALLPGSAFALSRALAVLGDGTELRHVAELARLENAVAADAAARLTRADVLADAQPLRFAHPILSTALAADLAAPECAQLHLEAARLLAREAREPARAAQHLLKTDAVGEQWAVEVLRAAAGEVLAAGAPATAVAYLRRAAEEPLTDDRSALLRELGAAEFVAGELTSLEHLEAALAAAEGPRDVAMTTRDLALPLLVHGRPDEALDALTAAAAALGPDDAGLALELQAQLSGLALVNTQRAAEVMEPLRRFEDAPGAVPAERVLLANLAYWDAISGGPCDRAAALAGRALAGGMLRDTSAASPSFIYATFVLIAADAYEAADAFLDDALDDAQRRASPPAFMAASSLRSLSAYRQGRLDVAEAEARAAVLSAREYGWERGFPLATAFLADALVDRGRLQDAREVIAGDTASGDKERPLLVWLLVARGRLALAEGDLRAGVDDLLEAGRMLEGGGTAGTAGTPTFRTYAAPALAALGERAEALRLAREELDTARAWGAGRSIGTALLANGLVEGGERGLDLLREAVETLEATPARHDLARALLALGEALRRSGSASEAREPLRRAGRLATECGAEALVERAEDELAATGARRLKRTMLAGSASLTPSERRIAQMAAEGLSNREIAQSLFLTKKTVETHLSHVYSKLGIPGRAQLAEALRTDA